MSSKRLIARLDVKAPNLIKGIHLEGLRVLGNPNDFAKSYYEQGADEILYIDAVASLYQRNSLIEVIENTARNIFIPITVGGGIRSLADVKSVLRAGADKVAINSAALRNPQLINEVANKFGAQCMVLSIEARKVAAGKWEAFMDTGREESGKDVIEWAEQAVELGAGEILITSIDMEGTGKGFDVELVHAIASKVKVPVIASGGMGNVKHLIDVIKLGKADAVAMATVLHYNKLNFNSIRAAAQENNIEVRRI